MPSLNKQQLVQAFSVMDIATLTKLYAYSQMLIIPDQDLLVNATKQQMEAWIIANAPALFPAWTNFQVKSDFGWFLCELFALFSEKDFWYINAFANEGLLLKGHIYSIAFVKAVSMGYDPVVSNGAQATFNVTFAAGSGTTYARGQLIVSIPSLKLFFTNDDPFTVPASGSPQTIPLVLSEGQQSASVVSFNGNDVILTQQNIDVESIDVQINNVDWRRVRVFGQSNSASTDYMALPEQDGSASIEFGDDGFGVRPNIGDTINVFFRICNGSKGNTGILPAMISSSLPLMTATGVTMANPAVGGTDPETLASIKNNAVMFFSSKKAAINSDVTEQILNVYPGSPGVFQSNVYAIGNSVYFQVIPKDGSVADAGLLAAIQTYLTPFLMLGYVSQPQTTTYINVAPLAMTISILKGFDVPTTVALVQQLVQDYTDPLVLATYGGNFDLTQLAFLIQVKVPGVQNVIFTEVQGTTPATIVVAPTNILKQINPMTDLTLTTIAA